MLTRQLRLVRSPITATVRSFSSTPRPAMAKLSIIGHLADTPELTPTSTGREIIRYAVATNSGPKDNRHTSWWNVTCFEQEGPRRDFLTALPKGWVVVPFISTLGSWFYGEINQLRIQGMDDYCEKPSLIDICENILLMISLTDLWFMSKAKPRWIPSKMRAARTDALWASSTVCQFNAKHFTRYKCSYNQATSRYSSALIPLRDLRTRQIYIVESNHSSKNE